MFDVVTTVMIRPTDQERNVTFSVLMLLVGRQEGYQARKN